jgi:Transposase
MADEHRRRQHHGESFWRAHHEAWKRSDLNQREYCEAQGIPLKAFGNWRAKFMAEPQPPVRKLLYRRGGLSHTLSHPLSQTLSHGTYPSSVLPAPIVAPAREGHRRRFSAADKCRILEEAAQPDASIAQIARRYGIARRVLCRWKQELASPVFVAVQITDADAPSGMAPVDEEHVL